MGEWKKVVASDFIEFNPRETLKKGAVAPKISMDVLLPFTRKVASYSEEAYNGGTKFRNQDTIMARITPCLENGKTSMVDILPEGAVGFGSTEYIVLRARPGISDSKFVYYLACSNIIRDIAIKSMVGSSGRQRVQQSVVNNIEFMAPELEEQKRIAAVLSSLDDKIELNNRINENLEQQTQALFKSWFVDFDPFNGVMPEYFKAKSVYDVAEYINGAAFKKNEYGTAGTPIIKITELKNGITGSTQYCTIKKDDKYYIDDKDILFSWSGNPDTSIDTFLWYRGYAVLNQHTFKVVAKEGQKSFTYFLLKHLKPQFTHIASNKQTTGLGHVTVADLKRLHFSACKETINEFESITKPIFDLIFSIHKENEHLAQLRDTLLPKLMSGEVDVSNVTS